MAIIDIIDLMAPGTINYEFVKTGSGLSDEVRRDLDDDVDDNNFDDGDDDEVDDDHADGDDNDDDDNDDDDNCCQ